MMKNQSLLHFAAVADRLSFRAAAEDLRIEQATLSRSIKHLEAQLGFRLLERTTRSVRLTPEGKALLPAAANLAVADQRAAHAIETLVRQANAVLQLGTHPYIYWSKQLNALLGRFASDAPGVVVRSSSGVSERNIKRLLDGSLDIAVIVESAVQDGLEHLPMMEVEANLLLPVGHPLTALATLNFFDVRDLAVAIVPPGRERADFDLIYAPFFDQGARMVRVTEGPQALLHEAARDNLALISLRPETAPPPDGFVRKAVKEAPRVGFVIATRAEPSRGLARRFWNSALRTLNLAP